ncbi:hypothetical protein [Burkholderia sp. LMU1-1-1.1]|uniref:hypothetical protein n=1 Tax=Burkholderia sp. LMU1-1-1.1 TaxID=3135266 RepID=UPI00343DAA24
MKKLLYSIALATSLAGCAASRDGVRLGTGPSDSDIARIKNQIAENAQKSAAKRAVTAAIMPDSKPGILVIGETGVLHELDPSRRKKNYKEFTDIAEKWHPGQTAYWDENEYHRRIGGWTTLEIYSIPGVIALKLSSAVTKEQTSSINFASAAGAWLINSTKDLVIARSNEDGISVIESVLCSSSLEDFKKCSDQYVKGQFDALSGLELDRSTKIKPDGARIDVASFKRM